MILGLGFRVRERVCLGAGFRVQGSGLRVQGYGLRVGFRVRERVRIQG
jgi:hypothetical protein